MSHFLILIWTVTIENKSINLLKAPQEGSRVCWVPIGPIQIITREETSSKWLTDWTRNFHHHEKVSFNNPY